MKLELKKRFHSLWSESAPLSAVVCIPASCFTPGEIIPVTTEVDNASNVRADRLRIILRKISTFKANVPLREIKKEKIIISEVSVGPIEPHVTRKHQLNIEIPMLPLFNLIDCNIIDLAYELKVCANKFE